MAVLLRATLTHPTRMLGHRADSSSVFYHTLLRNARKDELLADYRISRRNTLSEMYILSHSGRAEPLPDRDNPRATASAHALRTDHRTTGRS